MMNGDWWEYLIIFSSSAALCLTLTAATHGIARISSKARTRVAKPASAFAASTTGTVVVSSAITVPILSNARPLAGGRVELYSALAVGIALFLVGLIDHRRQMSPMWHIGAQVSAGIAISSTGGGIALQEQFPDVVNLLLTVIWFVTITTAFRYADQFGRPAIGLGGITSLGLFFLATGNGQVLLAALALGLAGCASGYFVYSRIRTQATLGLGGSMFMGFMIAYLSLRLYSSGNYLLNAITPPLLCSIYIFNILLIVIPFSLTTKRSAYNGNQNLVSRLLSYGLDYHFVIRLIYIGVVFTGSASVAINTLPVLFGFIILGATGLAFALSGIALLRVSSQRQAAITSDRT